MNKGISIILVFLVLIIISFVFFKLYSSNNPPIAPSINQSIDLSNIKSLMIITVHPDDEVYEPGLMSIVCKGNVKCYILNIGSLDNVMESVDMNARIRAIEWVDETYLDSYTILGNRFGPGTISQQLSSKIQKQVIAELDKIKPEVIVTFSPYGFSKGTNVAIGHPNHISLSKIVAGAIPKLSYKPMLYYAINPDPASREYKAYKSKTFINLENYKVKNGTAWDAKLEFWEVYRDSVPAIDQVLTADGSYLDLAKKEYYLRAK